MCVFWKREVSVSKKEASALFNLDKGSKCTISGKKEASVHLLPLSRQICQISGSSKNENPNNL